MNERDASALVGLFGVFVLWMSASSQLFRFVRPGMRPYTLLAGLALVATSAMSLVLHARRHHDEHGPHDEQGGHGDGHGHGRTKIVALVALPVVVGLVIAPGALGSWAAGRDRSALVDVSFGFDGLKFLTKHEHDREPPAMRVADFNAAAEQPRARALLASTPVRLEGFVAHYKGAATVNRFFIACCVADAALVSVRLPDEYADLSDDSWIEVVVHLDANRSPSAAAIAIDGGALALVDVASLRHIGQPSKPYEYLYG